MGMSVDAASWSPSQTAAWQQRKQDYSSLLTSSQSGDLSTAKSAYASLTANKTPPADSPLAALGAAIQSGDPAAVQQAAQTLQHARSGHHHHHGSASSSTASTTSVSTTSASSTTGLNIVV